MQVSTLQQASKKYCLVGVANMLPRLATQISECRDVVTAAKSGGLRVGLVPTMGALHAGHLSLIEKARSECGFVAVSIFVNPTQFGPKEDLSGYPRPFERDVQLCTRAGVDLVFHPTAETIYGSDFKTYVEVHDLQNVLCGASRPGHFRGVATVVLKLFNIIQPDVAYFGQKDAQQALVLSRMVRDLNVPVQLSVCPIVREPDGLAMSSRNVYLSESERASAPVLFRALLAMRDQIASGERDADSLIAHAATMISASPHTRIDYIAIVDRETLAPLTKVEGDILIALAVFVGTTRLIDNVMVSVVRSQ